MIDVRACQCEACRARLDREFWAIVDTWWPQDGGCEVEDGAEDPVGSFLELFRRCSGLEGETS